MPVTDWDQWVETMEAGEADIDMTDDMIWPSQYEKLLEYFYGIDPEWAETTFSH